MFAELVNKFLTDQRYLNKKEIMYRLPSTVPINEFWPELLQARKELKIELPLWDKDEHNMWICMLPNMQDKLKEIDKKAKHEIYDYIPDKMKETIIFEALVDEAFYSSVIEGAFSTKKRSKEMIMKKEIPANKSEQMIFNNHEALVFTLENIHKPITEDILLAIYRIVTKNTLDNEDQVRKYRNDAVFVYDPNMAEPIYEGPDHQNVQALMDLLFVFINRDDDLHPIIKSAIIHFYFVYVHPFFDGNGRTARCLAYMYLLQKGYNAFKFFSISSVVKEERSKYYKVIKDVEDNESDITYFLKFYNEMILKSVDNILISLMKELRKTIILSEIAASKIVLAKRQKHAINLFFKKDQKITIAEYAKKYKVVYETARTDLLQLVEIGVLSKAKRGKKYVYRTTEFEKVLDKYRKAVQ